MNQEIGQEGQVEEENEMDGKEIVAGLDEDTQWQGEESKQVHFSAFYQILQLANYNVHYFTAHIVFCVPKLGKNSV